MSLLESLQSKSMLKQDIYDICKEEFLQLRQVLDEIVKELQGSLEDLDNRLRIHLDHVHDFESRLFFGGDVLVFSMHSNIFIFPANHSIHQKAYIGADRERAFCGSLYIHNFLSDSFKYNRFRDLGLLIGRVFINKDRHFFVEGQRKLGFLYNSIETMELNKIYWKAIVENAMQFAIDHDLEVPDFQSVLSISVAQKLEMAGQALNATVKPIGYIRELTE